MPAPDRLPPWLWLWFPPVMAVIIFTTRLASPAFFSAWIEGENRLIELATPALAFAAFITGLLCWRMRATLESRAMRGWIVLVTLGCLYIAGEELSWGQQLFQWDTPDTVAALNDQNETNLHNMSSWFDQKPRLLLEIWVLVGGIMLPLRRMMTGNQPETAFGRWFWPPIECVPAAVLAIAIRLPERYRDVVGPGALPFEIRWSEPQEYYFSLFLLIYLLSIRARLLQGGARPR